MSNKKKHEEETTLETPVEETAVEETPVEVFVIVKTVCFDVGFIAYVKAVFVAKFDKSRVGGIMACTNHVYMTLLHYLKISYHMLHRSCIADKRI